MLQQPFDQAWGMTRPVGWGQTSISPYDRRWNRPRRSAMDWMMPRMMSALDMPFMGSWDMSPAMSRTLTGLAAPTRQWETDREMHIEMDVPDFSREDISAEIQGDYIVLSGSTTKNENTQFSESSRTASFNRSIALPSYVNKKQMNATLRGSTLHIEVPKYEFGKQPRSEQTRSITIN